MEANFSEERDRLVQKEKMPDAEYRTGANNLPGAGVMDFLSVITKHRKFISWFVVGATVLMTIVALLLPKWYKATAIVFPAPQADLLAGTGGVASLFQSLTSGRGLLSFTGAQEAERYAAILESETALMDVINKFQLTEVYEITRYPREKTTKELLSNMNIVFGDGGELEINVFDKDPIRAMMMGNYFVDVLNRINADLSAQNARATRAFIEERYTKLLQDIHSAEEALKEFQEKYGVYSLPVAELGVGYLRLYREVEIQSKLLEFILPLYEQAKVEEKRQTPSVTVLSYASMPERKAKPKVSLYALVTLVAATLISFLAVFSWEAVVRLRTLHPDRFNWIWKAMKPDWLGPGTRRDSFRRNTLE